MEEQLIENLIRFCGYGDYPNIQVLYVGNEEGLGGAENSYVVNERIDNYMQNGTPVVGDDVDGGYYWNPNPPEEGIPMPQGFINFCARQMLHFNEPNDINWFQLANQNPAAWTNILDYQMVELFKEQDRIFASGLFDLRPLPRINEEEYPHLYGNDFEWDIYLTAFRYGPNFDQGLEPYNAWRIFRAQIFYNLLQAVENLKVIIAPGDRHSKKRFFEFLNLHIEGINLQDDFVENNLPGGQPYYYNEIAILDQDPIPIFISNFYQNGYGIGLGGLNELSHVIIDELHN